MSIPIPTGHYIVPLMVDQVRFSPQGLIPIVTESVSPNHIGLLFIPTMSADGNMVATEVLAATEEDELSFPVMTADGKITLVKFMPAIRCNSCDSSELAAEYTVTFSGYTSPTCLLYNSSRTISYLNSPSGDGSCLWADETVRVILNYIAGNWTLKLISAHCGGIIIFTGPSTKCDPTGDYGSATVWVTGAILETVRCIVS